MSSPAQSPSSRFEFLLILFSLSGATSLIFETIFTRLLTYTFGNTAYAVSTVFAAFLGGLALGAFAIGRWVDRRPPSILIYGALELAAGVYCLFLPKLFTGTTELYVAAYRRFSPGPAQLTVLRFALAAVVMLIPTVLMGGSLPALARYVAHRHVDFASQLDRLYAANTIGAACGTLISTFILMPSFGVGWTTGIASAVNFVVFAGAVIFQRADSPTFAPMPATRGRISDSAVAGLPRRKAALLVGAFFTGAVALAYEVLWTHLLSFTVGNTVYAFGTMLFAMLCGMGWGARIVSRYVSQPGQWARALAGSQLALGVAVLLLVPVWDRIPDFFDLGLGKTTFISLGVLVLFRVSLVAWSNHRAKEKPPWIHANEPLIETVLFCLVVAAGGSLLKYDATFFIAGEFVRFFCAFALLIVPALLLGLSFPLLLNLYAGDSSNSAASVGIVYAANTCGAILGSLLMGFALLPRFGSFSAMRSLAIIDVALGALFAVLLLRLDKRTGLALGGALAIVLVLFAVLPWHWDLRRLSRGSYVYFGNGYHADRVLFAKEDVQGGLTTVVQIGNERLLLSNGKFQGNDAGAVQAQIRFALIPTLFTHDFREALVIGLGTGNTLRTISHFPFERIDVAELSPSIVEASRDWFESVNGRAFDRDPRVHLSIADGRNFLLVSQRKYDLITIEITSIWIAGEADLYNREFYRLCREHLQRRGILQQWVQIHHMRTQDLLAILNTAAQEFPHVAFFQGPTQGLIVASASPLECDDRELSGFDQDPEVRQDLATIGAPSMASLLGEMMAYGGSLDLALSQSPESKGRRLARVSTDFHPYLEYQTPKDNALPYDTAKLNVEFFRNLQPRPLPPELRFAHLNSNDDRNLLLGYVREQEGDSERALDYFRKVGGTDKPRAEREIEHLELRAGARKLQ